ncbi:trimeric intracellular cation channel family protein [Kiloniella sp. b19]|uniref:trimeric intracellular cation channel family protein n=1 Tax=Kiloniella sp. GXU_MW_B19 TaxID=3141326 RepID=UPI0031D7728B
MTFDLALNLTAVLDLTAVFVFALTGALVASRAQLDIIGFVFFACLTAVGGGTVRDVILGAEQVFWVANPVNLFVASAAAIVVYFSAHLLESRYRVLIWIDALALPVAVSAGVSATHDMGQEWAIILLMGVITGTFGGLLRDVVANEMPLLLKQREMYASAAVCGVIFFPLVILAGGSEREALWATAIVTFLLRAGSLALGWRIPVYKPRPIRTSSYDDNKPL